MRAVERLIRPPGVYPAADEPRASRSRVSDTRIAGFVGLAAQGSARRAGAARRLERVRRHLRSLPNDELPGARRRGLLPQRRHDLLRGARRAPRAPKPRRARSGPSTPRAPSASSRTAGTSRRLRVRALNEGRWGNNIWVRFQQTHRGAHAAHARPRGRRRARRASTRRAASSAARWCASTIARTPTTSSSPRSTTASIRWGAATPIIRRYRAAGPTYLEVLEFELYASLQRSPRGVPRAADVAAVAPLRAARRQRRVAAGSSSRICSRRRRCRTTCREAEPRGQADRRARRHRRAHAPKTSSASITGRAIAPA